MINFPTKFDKGEYIQTPKFQYFHSISFISPGQGSCYRDEIGDRITMEVTWSDTGSAGVVRLFNFTVDVSERGRGDNVTWGLEALRFRFRDILGFGTEMKNMNIYATYINLNISFLFIYFN